MKHEALNELFQIVKESQEDLRVDQLKEWENKWIYYTESTQYVVNKSVLNTEEIDFVWNKVVEKCAEDLLENRIVDSNTTNNSFTCKVWALRKPNAKLKESPKNVKKTR